MRSHTLRGNFFQNDDIRLERASLLINQRKVIMQEADHQNLLRGGVHHMQDERIHSLDKLIIKQTNILQAEVAHLDQLQLRLTRDPDHIPSNLVAIAPSTLQRALCRQQALVRLAFKPGDLREGFIIQNHIVGLVLEDEEVAARGRDDVVE